MTEETNVTRLPRQHALSGLIASGTFLVVMLGTHATALRGSAAWYRSGARLERTDILVFVELVFVLGAFAAHLVLGAKLARARVARVLDALLAVFFLVHFVDLSGRRAFGGLTADGTYTHMVESYSRTWGGLPLFSLLVIAGTGLACWKLAESLFAIGRPRVLANVVGAAFFVVGAASVVALATGTGFAPAPLPDAACGAAVETSH